jgi:esterase/lipase superfamily enzyme
MDIPASGHFNAKLDASEIKDIFICVHGFKVVFKKPLLVAAELWHFLGYEGLFVAYAWPSTPSNRAYVADLETAVLSSQNFRKFLQYLAEETHVRHIHIIGYSAGTRIIILKN